MRRTILVLLAAIAAVAAVGAGPAFASTPPTTPSTGDPVTTTTIDNHFLDTQRDLSDCLNHSVDLPGCGIEPTSSGDRGGALQLATFGVLTLAIVFISWRVVRAVRARDAALSADLPS